MLSRSQGSGHLAGKVDKNRIGVLGLSLGGMTTTLVSFDGRMRDERIKAAVSIAGPARMFNHHFFSTSDIPFMMIAADQDALVTYKANALPVLDRDPDSILVTLKNGSHTGFAGISAYIFRWLNHPDVIGCKQAHRSTHKPRILKGSDKAVLHDVRYTDRYIEVEFVGRTQKIDDR